MTVKVYDHPRVFWDEVSDYLKLEESKNSLCLGRAYHFLSDSTDCFYLSALFEDEKFLGALVGSRHFQNLSLLPTPVENEEYARVLFKAFRRTRKIAHSLVTESRTADFYKKLFLDSGKLVKTQMRQGIYRCQKVLLPENIQKLKFRVASLNDLETIAKWISDFHLEAVPKDPLPNSRELAEAKIKQKAIYVAEKGKRVVSMAAWGRDIESSCSINLVYTPPMLRGKGFASFVTAALTRSFLEKGKKEISLYTDLENPTSNKIYQNIGYEFVCQSTHYAISSKRI